MHKKKRKAQLDDKVIAPGIDEADAYGQEATDADITNDESTKVTRFVYDEYDPSDE